MPRGGKTRGRAKRRRAAEGRLRPHEGGEPERPVLDSLAAAPDENAGGSETLGLLSRGSRELWKIPEEIHREAAALAWKIAKSGNEALALRAVKLLADLNAQNQADDHAAVQLAAKGMLAERRQKRKVVTLVDRRPRLDGAEVVPRPQESSGEPEEEDGAPPRAGPI